jgi:diphthamide biosynthesis protein 2
MASLSGPLPLSDDHPDELLSRVITPPVNISGFSLEETYEIERTVRLLKQESFKSIALQFPDDILHDAAKVSKKLQDALEGVKLYILGDTSYGRLPFADRTLTVVVASMKLLQNMSMQI